MTERDRKRQGGEEGEREEEQEQKQATEFLFQGEGRCREMQEGFTEEAPSTAA